MGVRKYKPTTPGRRGASVSSVRRAHARPSPRSRSSRRAATRPAATSTGGSPRATRAAGHKRRYRVDRLPPEQGRRAGEGRAHRVRPEPQRAHRAAALRRRREALHHRARRASRQGDPLMSGPDAEIRPGNALPLRNIPVGTVVHAIELKPGAGAKMARSAGASVQLMAKEGAHGDPPAPVGRDAVGPGRLQGHRRLGRQRRARADPLGKAGRNRWQAASARRSAASR